MSKLRILTAIKILRKVTKKSINDRQFEKQSVIATLNIKLFIAHTFTITSDKQKHVKAFFSKRFSRQVN